MSLLTYSALYMPKAKESGKSRAVQDYRMAELVAESGVSRDMIKYYLRAKLLPKPHKPRHNLSLYAESHLALIRLILRFQVQTKLSLPEIAQVFAAANHEPGAIEIELLSDKYAAVHHDNIIPFEASTANTSALSFPPEFIQELRDNGLWEVSTKPSKEQEKTIGLLWAARSAGVPIEFFLAAREHLSSLADLEVKALIAIRRPHMDFDGVMQDVTEVDRIINRWIVSEKTDQARGMFQRIIENSENALATVHDAIYFPSDVFRQRFTVDRQIASLLAGLEENHDDIERLLSASKACLLLTNFDIALDCADKVLEKRPDNDTAIAVKSLAYGMSNDLEKALMYAKRLEADDSHHALALEARLLTVLMQAAKLGGVSDTSELLKDAAELFRTPVAALPVDQFEWFESALLQARANTMFPDAINNAPAAIASLQDVLEKLETMDELTNAFPIAATRIVYQVYTNFYLGQLHEVNGEHEKAQHYFSQVIQLDPSSNFGERAYLKLT